MQGLLSTERTLTQGFLYRKCNGLMGVPITFFDNWSAEQFNIIGCAEPYLNLKYIRSFGKTEYKSRQVNFNGKACQKTYHRLFIRKRGL